MYYGMEELIKKLKTENLTDYKSIPFWSWNNKLNKKELLRQICDMKRAGHGGFIMHARTGLKTEYLSEDWFGCIDVCLKQAKKLNLNAWIYDENGWPSGFVGGKLLEDKENLAKYLTYEIKDYYDEKALAVYDLQNDCAIRIDSSQKLEKYHTIYLNLSPANTDILDAKVVDKFIRLTYEEYYKRFKDSFGNELKGFFTDEPQYYRYATPYTAQAAQMYKKLYGDEILDGLLYLFIISEKGYSFRVRYYQMMNYLYTENYYKKIYLWCKQHNCKLTGHSVEETKLFTQMWGAAGCSTSYEYEHIPSIDNLAKNSTALLSAKQVFSVSAQLGKKQILTETFGCSGYDVTPRELMHIAERQYVHGVNFMCQHLMPYSLAGQGKIDHPPCFSKHMTWWKEYKIFNDYFTNLGYLLVNSYDLADTAIISPMQSVFLNYIRNNEKLSFEIDKQLEKLQAILQEKNINYHFIDETILQNYGKAEGGKVQVGNCRYKYLIVPYCLTLKDSTVEILKKHKDNSGKIYCYGKPYLCEGQNYDYSFLNTNCTLQEIKNSVISIKSNGKISYTYRDSFDGKFIYLLNEDDKAVTVTLPEDNYKKLNIENLKFYKIENSVTLQKYQSVVITQGKCYAKEHVYKNEKDITDCFKFERCSVNSYIIDNISISFDGINFEKPSYVYEVFERLVKADYKGKLFVKYCFFVKDKCALKIVKEKNAAKKQKINGNNVNFKKSKFDINFIEADITNFVHTGLNEFTYEINYTQDKNLSYALYDKNATESLRNCLAFKTEIESVYIEGDFALNGSHQIISPQKNINISNIEKSGYSFFAGEMVFRATINSQQRKAVIKLIGNFAIANVIVNGKKYIGAVLSSEVPLNNLKIGENDIILIIKSSLRNKFGPHHSKQNEEDGVSPFSYNMRDTWEKGESKYYDKKYKTINFGIDKVILNQIQ